MKALINKKLPKLIHVSRPTAWQVLIFAIFNVVLGISMLTSKAKTLELLIVNDLMTLQFWGYVYLVLGSLLFIGFFANSWNLMRFTNVAALFVKLFWVIGLTARQIETPDSNLFLIIMFSALAAQQINLVLFFPTNKEASDDVPVGSITIAKELIK